MEILVAVAIIAILAAGLYTVSSYLETQSKIKLTESTIQTLCAAIEQYRDFYGHFPFQADPCYSRIQLESNAEPNCLDGSVVDKNGNPLSTTDYDSIYASSEALYYFLNKVPASRKIVESVNRLLITNKDYKGTEYFIRFGTDTTNYPLIHIIDAWQRPLRYTYKEGDNFPLIESAGPNRNFDPCGVHIDDISSR